MTTPRSRDRFSQSLFGKRADSKQESKEAWLSNWGSVFTIETLNKHLKIYLAEYQKKHGKSAKTGSSVINKTPISIINKLGWLPTSSVPALEAVTASNQDVVSAALADVTTGMNNIASKLQQGEYDEYRIKNIFNILEKIIEHYKNLSYSLFGSRTATCFENAFKVFLDIDVADFPITSDKFKHEFERKRKLIFEKADIKIEDKKSNSLESSLTI